MRYQDAVFDRTAADVVQRTSKGYFNASDWNRLRNNMLVTKGLIGAMGRTLPYYFNIPFVFVGTIPYANDLTHICLNVRSLITGSGIPDGTYPGFAQVPEVAFSIYRGLDHSDLNTWEQMADIIYQNVAAYYSFSSWVPAAGSPSYKERIGVATCGAGFLRNNGFVKYA